jgi:hypothetical protein
MIGPVSYPAQWTVNKTGRNNKIVYLDSYSRHSDSNEDEREFVWDDVVERQYSPAADEIMEGLETRCVVRKALKAALAPMRPRDRNIVTRRIVKDHDSYSSDTLQKLGDIYGITRERVRQIQRDEGPSFLKRAQAAIIDLDPGMGQEIADKRARNIIPQDGQTTSRVRSMRGDEASRGSGEVLPVLQSG